MNKELFASMGAQIRPSPEAQAALREKLAQGVPVKRPVPWRRYAALAACLALVIAAVPLWQMRREHQRWEQILENFQHDAEVVPAVEGSAIGDAGDRDQTMTPDELAVAMAEAGFSQADIDSYGAQGWRMTWANWWKFVHLSEEAGDRSLEALVDFSRKNCVTVVEIPAGVYEEDAASAGSGGYVHLPAPADAPYAEPIIPAE